MSSTGSEADYSAVSSWFNSLSSQPAFQQGITAVYGKSPDTKILKVGLNPYLTNGFSHHYHLGESTSVLRGIRRDF